MKRSINASTSNSGDGKDMDSTTSEFARMNSEHSASTDKLLHELQVHQIELEMQNEELLRVNAALEESQRRYLDLYEFASVGYITLTQTALISEISLNGATLLGSERQKLQRCAFAEFVSPPERDSWRRLFLDVLQNGGKRSFELTLQRRDGSKIAVRLNCMRMEQDQEILGLRVGMIDITDLADLRRVVADTKVAAIVFESQQAMMITDNKSIILRVNSAFTKITGYAENEAIGKPVALLKSGYHDVEFYANMWKDIDSKGSWQGEIWNRRKSGDIYPALVTITAVKSNDGTVTHYVGTNIDITERKEAEARIENLAFYDPLTGLPNRRLLLDRLQQALSSSDRSGRIGALMFIDLDEFKVINDTLGHDFGDQLLKSVAERLSDCVREGDTVARLSGDEFVVILENLSESEHESATDAKRIGEKILSSLGQSYHLDGYTRHASASIGVALFSGHKSIIKDLLKRADLAMYEAKASGRNALRFFDPEMQAIVLARAEMENSLRMGILKNEFVLYFQPQISGNTHLIGSEALVRWNHPSLGLILPHDFIPLAEQTGLILPLGLWILQAACAQLTTWALSTKTASLSMAVNVSARQFYQPNFVNQVMAVLESSGANPSKLKLELTEGVMLTNVEETISKMQILQELGVRFSLDDFGIGYSSLSFLKRLPLNQLKIDRSFVRNVLTDPDDSAIAKMVINLARELNLEIIAEGVETEAQRNFLAQCGCFDYQGFLFAPALPSVEFAQMTSRI
jgi:diguanylate cyclase (GGDEF)-like protein/PAS domain S-box-containing protein